MTDLTVNNHHLSEIIKRYLAKHPKTNEVLQELDEIFQEKNFYYYHTMQRHFLDNKGDVKFIGVTVWKNLLTLYFVSPDGAVFSKNLKLNGKYGEGEILITKLNRDIIFSQRKEKLNKITECSKNTNK